MTSIISIPNLILRSPVEMKREIPNILLPSGICHDLIFAYIRPNFLPMRNTMWTPSIDARVICDTAVIFNATQKLKILSGASFPVTGF